MPGTAETVVLVVAGVLIFAHLAISAAMVIDVLYQYFRWDRPSRSRRRRSADGH